MQGELPRPHPRRADPRPTSCGPAPRAWPACRSARPSSTSWTRSSTCARYLTLSEGALPVDARRSRCRTSAARGQSLGPAGRRAPGLGARVSTCRCWSRARRCEYLYWVGCSASYDRRNQAIARSVVRHPEEGRRDRSRSCRRSAATARWPDGWARSTSTRRWQTENVEALNQYKFRKVITTLPALLQHHQERVTRSSAGPTRSMHHSQVIDRADPERPHQARSSRWPATVVFHDSCYLGRYNGIMEAPREVARRAAGAARGRPAARRERGLCCGGGGGTCGWRSRPPEAGEHHPDRGGPRRPGASVVATACPFCLAMVDLGRKGRRRPRSACGQARQRAGGRQPGMKELLKAPAEPRASRRPAGRRPAAAPRGKIALAAGDGLPGQSGGPDPRLHPGRLYLDDLLLGALRGIDGLFELGRPRSRPRSTGRAAPFHAAGADRPCRALLSVWVPRRLKARHLHGPGALG